MTSVHRPDLDPPRPLVLGHAPWLPSGVPWGELSVDQPDGFGTVSEPELPSPDVNDDRGYGFGV
jgi:hypothetical protein